MASNILENFDMKFKETDEVPAKEPRKVDYEWKIVWKNVIVFIYIHLAGLYGLYVALFYAKLWTLIWSYTVFTFSILGITAGAHRLWCHRTYKAKWPVRLILMFLQASAFQNDLYVWIRDHRMHHKYTDTDADPLNARRGFFFSHIGWLMVRKHPDVISKGATVNMSDVEQDPIVKFQRKWYPYLMALGCFIVPTLVPMWAWNESLWYAWHIAIARYAIGLNCAWSANSAAHIWGVKPFDKSITPTDNVGVSVITFGEGWHNYHHVFPWDYKAAELPYYFNVTTALIDFFAYLGLAYDLKTASPDIIKKRALRSSEMSY